MHHDNDQRGRRGRTTALLAAGALMLALLPPGSAAAGPDFGGWAPADKIDEIAGNHPDLNTTSLDGCPAQSPDGLLFFMASNRPGGKGGLDIWMASRPNTSAPWGAPQNLPEPINSLSDDFCPTPFEGGGLLFVSRRSIPGVTCGLGDIYRTRWDAALGWATPDHLACAPDGPNSALDEQGPSFVQGELYFSRSTLPPGTSGELFVSRKHGQGFGPASPIAELNDPNANDIQPNVRKDGRELVFSSTRIGGMGGPDIWISTRASAADTWSAPVNLGPAVNTAYGESRPFLSSDGGQLLFGRAGPVGTGEGGQGAADIYVTTRDKNPGSPFTGTWVGQDPPPPDGDGSTVHLVITGGWSHTSIEFTDEFGSVCENVGASVTEFTGRLTGQIDGSTLNATFRSARCGSTRVEFLVGESFWWELDDGGTSDPSDDTLFDGSVLWSRA